MPWILYVATFPHGKRYFGVTSKSLEWRISSHKRTSKKRRTIFHKALAKYGDAVTFDILATGDRAYILYAEYRSVERYQTRDRRFGYNHALGGALSPMLVPEIAKRVADAKRGKRLVPPEVIQRRAEAKEKRRIARADRARAYALDPHSPFSVERDRLKADPIWRANRAARLRELNAEPEFRAGTSKRQSDRWKTLHSDPEFQARHRERAVAQNADQEFKAKLSSKMRDRWKDPEFRELMRGVHAKRRKITC